MGLYEKRGRYDLRLGAFAKGIDDALAGKPNGHFRYRDRFAASRYRHGYRVGERSLKEAC